MKKKMLAIALTSILSLGLVGCGDPFSDSGPGDNRFFDSGQTYVIDKMKYSVWVDRETKNEYLVSNRSSDIVPLFDANAPLAKYQK